MSDARLLVFAIAFHSSEFAVRIKLIEYSWFTTIISKISYLAHNCKLAKKELICYLLIVFLKVSISSVVKFVQ